METTKRFDYDGNTKETYDLFFDGNRVIEMPVGEDYTIEIVEDLNDLVFSGDKINIVKLDYGFTVYIFNENGLISNPTYEF